MAHQLVKASLKNVGLIPKLSKHVARPTSTNEIELLLKRSFGLSDEGTFYLSSLSTKEGSLFTPKFNMYKSFSKPVNVLGYVNGVLCLNNRISDSEFMFWNPIDDRVKILPTSSIQSHPVPNELCFWGSGFGFDEKSNEFKVITFIEKYDFEADTYHYHEDNQYVEVYSSLTDSWKQIPDPAILPVGSSVYVGGVYYWYALSERGYCILAFNFSTEKFEQIDLPDASMLKKKMFVRVSLFEFCGSLCAIVYPTMGIEKVFDIWVMKEEDKSWSKIFDCPVVEAEIPLGIWKTALFFEGVNRDLLVLDLPTGELKKLGIHEGPLTMTLLPHVMTT